MQSSKNNQKRHSEDGLHDVNKRLLRVLHSENFGVLWEDLHLVGGVDTGLGDTQPRCRKRATIKMAKNKYGITGSVLDT